MKMVYHLLVSCMHLNALGRVRVMSNNVTRMLHLACFEAQEPLSPFFLSPTLYYSLFKQWSSEGWGGHALEQRGSGARARQRPRARAWQ